MWQNFVAMQSLNPLATHHLDKNPNQMFACAGRKRETSTLTSVLFLIKKNLILHRNFQKCLIKGLKKTAHNKNTEKQVFS